MTHSTKFKIQIVKQLLIFDFVVLDVVAFVVVVVFADVAADTSMDYSSIHRFLLRCHAEI